MTAAAAALSIPPPPSNASPPAGRFIPCRGATDMENSYHSLVRGGGSSADTTASASFSATGSPTEQQQQPAAGTDQQALAETLNNGLPRDTRILSFRAKAPQPSDSQSPGGGGLEQGGRGQRA